MIIDSFDVLYPGNKYSYSYSITQNKNKVHAISRRISCNLFKRVHLTCILYNILYVQRIVNSSRFTSYCSSSFLLYLNHLWVVRIQCPLNRPTFTVCKLSRRHVNYVVLFLQCIVHCTVHCQDAIWFILSISTVYTVSRRHLNFCILSQFYSVWSVKASSELYFSISTVYTVSRRHLNYIVHFYRCIVSRRHLNYIVTFLQCTVSRRHRDYIVPFLQCTLSQGTVWIILSHFLQCTLSQGAILIILSHFYSVQCQGAMWIMVWRLALIE